jgi:hypothetical protein
MRLDVNELYETLIDEEYFTEAELNLITNINGYNLETLNDCIYARYGFRTYEQMKGEDDE